MTIPVALAGVSGILSVSGIFRKRCGMPKPLTLGEVSAEQTERARMLPKSQTHSDTHPVCQSHRIAVLSCFILPGLPSQALARQLSQRESPWQRGFVFDETDLRLLENVTECQSLSLWERCLRSRRRGQGCCPRARHTAIRTLLVRAIVSQRRWSNFTGLALSGAGAPAPLAGEPLAKRCRFAEID